MAMTTIENSSAVASPATDPATDLATSPVGPPAGPAQPRLGIDIGRVIIDGGSHPAGGDTAFLHGDEATMLATPEIPGAVEVIRALVTAFEGRVWLVSKCGPRVQGRSERWLLAHDFYGRTGLMPSHVRFCRTRPDKRIHCVELHLTHFVDDNREVHRAIRGSVRHQYLFGVSSAAMPGVTPTPTWAVAGDLIIGTLSRASGGGRSSAVPGTHPRRGVE
jgi:hypothetical protein